MKWKLLCSGGNSPMTVFADDDELLAFLHHEPLIGEDMVKAYTRERGELVESVERCATAAPSPSVEVPTNQAGTIDRARAGHATIRTTAVGSNRIDFDQDERFLSTAPYPFRRDRRPRGASHLLQRGERVRRAPSKGPGAARAGDDPRFIAVGKRRGAADCKRVVGP